MDGRLEAEEGIVKQFTGDGAPVRHPDDPARAVRAALGLLDRLVGLNARLHEVRSCAVTYWRGYPLEVLGVIGDGDQRRGQEGRDVEYVAR